ncbi:uncharacterized protein LOC141664435 [Apium graveolens]|uniref:uncharacterized protein LOC141664435 n=1 Tax=Apium graveolens TaxID=4045 RepID=UPI003D7AFD7E
MDFVHRAIVCRYEIPYQLISDNGKQFDSEKMNKFCKNRKIKKSFPVVSHPKSNRYIEAIYKIIKHTSKTRLEDIKGNGSTNYLEHSGRITRLLAVPRANEVNHRLYLDMLKETRQDSDARLASYHQRVARYYNGKVKVLPLHVGDLVLRRVMPNTKVPGHGVFGANWVGTYKVKAVLWEDSV